MPATITPERCPHCGELPRGTLEVVHGVALLEHSDEIDDGYEYAGETKMFWDDQQSVTDPGDNGIMMLCHEGHEWSAKVDGEF